MATSIVFFGSFQDYSVQVLNKLNLDKSFSVASVITTTPKPKGRGLKPSPNPTHEFALAHNLHVLTPQDPGSSPEELLPFRPDFMVVAGYGKLLHKNWLDFPKSMAINLHPSLLPAYRGANPAEWAILNNESQTGVTLIKMSEKFDQGGILAQEICPISAFDTRETLYGKLFDQGASLLTRTLPQILARTITPRPQTGDPSTAPALKRSDGFIPRTFLISAVNGEMVPLELLPELFRKIVHRKNLNLIPAAIYLELAVRALSGWPGVWTALKNGKRLKLLSGNLTPDKAFIPILIQEEGGKPKPFNSDLF